LANRSKLQRRTLSSFIEWAVHEAVKKASGVSSKWGDAGTAEQIAMHHWRVHEADRFISLATFCGELLSYDEERLFNLIVEKQPIWDCEYSKTKCYVGNIHFENFPVLRYLFRAFKEQINNPSPNFDKKLEAMVASFELLEDQSI